MQGERVEIHRAPAADAYTDQRLLRRGDRGACLALPDIVLTVDDILG